MIEKALQTVADIWRSNLPVFTDKFQACVSTQNFYQQTENINWTTGFCTGELWLCYEHTGEDAFKQAALKQVESFLHRIQHHIDVDHHDMGFLYTPSCVAAYKLTGSEDGKKAALLAADQLISRFQQKGQFIQAWGKPGEEGNYRLIIDCLMNLPLLYWASEQTGDPKYRAVALLHTQTSLKHLVRPDHSTYHTYFFDPETGAPLRGVTAQGYRDGSAWARGQAWGIYGLALCYRYTKQPEVLLLFHQVAEFFLSRLPADVVPYWDLEFTAADGEPRDSSAGAIAACGMLEMCKYLDEGKAAFYRAQAERMAIALWQTCAVKDKSQSNGLLLHGVYAKKSPYNTVNNYGVDECNTWGDYFWLELLTRLSKPWEIYW